MVDMGEEKKSFKEKLKRPIVTGAIIGRI